MTLKLFNTLSGQKENFEHPLEKPVLMYACGPTVYDLSHLGHARMAITFDVVQRYLRFLGYKVTFVRNITDVDDKIIVRAKELGERPEQIARRYIYTFWKDMAELNVQFPDAEPRATEYISFMQSFIEQLLQKGIAYVSGKDVYFNVCAYKAYGKLKKQSIEDLMHGARSQVRSQDELKEQKKNPVDFALWKSAPTDEPGWQSPWGWGRPGWHLECSTMIKHVMGETIDIHGGGEDLVFPHHENEIAQSESLHEKPLARYWIHNSFVQVNQEKMSKSLGNFSTIQEVLKQYPADVIRFFVLQTHYRSPIEFSTESMEAARTGFLRLLRASRFANSEDKNGDSHAADHSEDLPTQNERLGSAISALKTSFTEAMNNDFNTPQALSALFAMADSIFNTSDSDDRRRLATILTKYAQVLGLTMIDCSKTIDSSTAAELVELLLTLRDNARQSKDFKSSDLIRDELKRLGISVMDVKGSSAIWERC